ncbi:hypothetical protein PsorP6_016036 [Peronosclerospora sorghi]|uniref:Uncharacterized protein n=1 Tax=Peronosclerospora sorghi TaxID=230839 RepID=A0ACC0WNW3_9STRA|nr:hypothetical protein PsorP6_016036 [Peronosclerospora sorghi]
MALPREVVSLSQLLRRNEKSSARPRIGTAPPLPLQTSRRRVQPQPSRLPPSFTECVRDANRVQPQSSRLPPSFTESVRDANRVQPDGSQPGVALELSQKGNIKTASLREANNSLQCVDTAYEAESEQLSALTSISQSSFSQTQSQNLLGSSQETKVMDDELQTLRQAQLWEALPSAPKSPVRCNGSEILQDLNQNFTKAIAEQIREQKQQQRQLMLQFASPMKKSVEQIRTDLVTCKKDHQSQVKAIGELAKTINKVTSAVSELQKQVLYSAMPNPVTIKPLHPY